ncbi:hypothetical protein ACFOEK_11860 [Litoribrevibacter euphylliae]|uniref:Chemotaxis methyl-accepting receptor HlyB-like 4HB MCP domain-containing protein n=1 Tax=Litoribrevibacter euphylliae TaxID=1834034 RepID=A0ABV7HCX5_9GAMM
MPSIQTGVQKSAKKLNHRELTNSGFWVGHILMIIATIAGVYLAAQAGLQQAIIFDDVTSKQNNYYLRASLYEEVSDNIRILREYDKAYLSRGVPAKIIRDNSPKVSRYVWETMKYSQATLETPSFFLGEIRRFYVQVDDIIEKREAFTYGPAHASKLMNEVVDRMEKVVLPKLLTNAQDLAAYLEEYDVVVESISSTQSDSSLQDEASK